MTSVSGGLVIARNKAIQGNTLDTATGGGFTMAGLLLRYAHRNDWVVVDTATSLRSAQHDGGV